MPAGRPSSYKPEFADQARQLCELGATDREVAIFFKIRESTLYRWQAKHPELCEALKVGKTPADDRVERSLYRRALGYSHDAVKILQHEGRPVIVPYQEHFPPETVAAIFWLKNRRPERWRDIRAVEHSGKLTHHHVTEISDAELAAIAAGSSDGVVAQKDGTPEPGAVH